MINKRINREVLRREKLKQDDFNSTLYKLTFELNKHKSRIQDLENQLATSVSIRKGIHKRIQNAFMKGIASINDETLTALELKSQKHKNQNIPESLFENNEFEKQENKLGFVSKDNTSSHLDLGQNTLKYNSFKYIPQNSYRKPNLDSKDNK